MAQLNFRNIGQGQPVIVLHGLYGASDNWVSVARELMGYCNVYLLDMRNHGASPHLPEHTYQAMVDDILEFMNDQDIYSAIFLGHSMGGKVAMSFAGLHPERVKKLIVVDISPRTYSTENGDQQIEEHEKIISALSMIDLSLMKSRNQIDELLKKQISNARVRQFLMKNVERTKDKAFKWKLNLNVLKDSLPNVLIGLEDEEEDIKTFNNPVLFIKGENSDYIQEKDKKYIKEIFSHAKIETIGGASHWVHAEKSDEFIQIVKEFCR